MKSQVQRGGVRRRFKDTCQVRTAAPHGRVRGLQIDSGG